MASDDERIAKYFGNRRADDNDMIELPSGTYRGVLKGALIGVALITPGFSGGVMTSVRNRQSVS